MSASIATATVHPLARTPIEDAVTQLIDGEKRVHAFVAGHLAASGFDADDLRAAIRVLQVAGQVHIDELLLCRDRHGNRLTVPRGAVIEPSTRQQDDWTRAGIAVERYRAAARLLDMTAAAMQGRLA
jgi:hypothetical protein